MANNCQNYIEITGNKSQLKKLAKDLELDSKSGCDTGYDIYENLRHKYKKNLGDDARWFDIDASVQEDNISISGDSAWCPCLELFTEISKVFPKLKIKYNYEEMGCDFSGWADIENGDCNDNCFKYWKGIIIREGEDDALDLVLAFELECYESEEELIESDMYLAFTKESQEKILESFKGVLS